MSKKSFVKVMCSIQLADRSTWVTLNMYVEEGKVLPDGPFAVRVGEQSENINPNTGAVVKQIALSGEVLFAHPTLEYYTGLSLHSVDLPEGRFHLCKVGSPVNWAGAVDALLA